jgi:hypothetical protein
MIFRKLLLYTFILTLMMFTASGKEELKLNVYEESLENSDPFEEDNKVNFELKKIGELVVNDQYLILFFQGVFEEGIKEKKLTHPFAGKPVYLEIQVGNVKNRKLIQLNLGYEGGFYIINRDLKSGKFTSYHPSYNRFYTRMMQEYLVSQIKGLMK